LVVWRLIYFISLEEEWTSVLDIVVMRVHSIVLEI
jgi:hypothetical protein